ncbi:hypothetical protein TYRP_008864 [Tyrophagus putrescentiae]|nr:hypothetical protein TYRP_008864 [Tyrophagus putrescentiae]
MSEKQTPKSAMPLTATFTKTAKSQRTGSTSRATEANSDRQVVITVQADQRLKKTGLLCTSTRVEGVCEDDLITAMVTCGTHQ